MAEARCKQQELAYARGEAEEKPYLSVETGYIRRRISVAAVSCFGQRLVSRMSQVGDQNLQLAAGRRRAWGMEEERARGEREASWLAKVTGRDIVRIYMFIYTNKTIPDEGVAPHHFLRLD